MCLNAARSQHLLTRFQNRERASSSSAFFLFGVCASSFHSPCSLVLYFFSLYSCSFVYFLITSLHLRFGLPIFRCPLTSIFHVLITTSSVFLSTESVGHPFICFSVSHKLDCTIYVPYLCKVTDQFPYR